MNKVLQLQSVDIISNEKVVVKNLNLSINSGEIHAIMGPNGSGKSSLAFAIMGHPGYEVRSGSVTFFGDNITALPPEKRAKRGLFLAFQYPYEIPGASVFSVLKSCYTAITGKLVSFSSFSALLHEKMDLLKIDKTFASRSLNDGFSGGEKKKFEILQMLLLKPKLAILDEIDSGLDIDSLQIVSDAIVNLKKENPDMCLLIITHYSNILKRVHPDFVHIMSGGKIRESGDFLVAKIVEQQGYSRFSNAS